VLSTFLLARGQHRVAPVIHGGVSLGFWVAVVWDRRRFLPPYGEEFVTADPTCQCPTRASRTDDPGASPRPRLNPEA
jgi:hypothetical protein